MFSCSVNPSLRCAPAGDSQESLSIQQPGPAMWIVGIKPQFSTRLFPQTALGIQIHFSLRKTAQPEVGGRRMILSCSCRCFLLWISRGYTKTWRCPSVRVRACRDAGVCWGLGVCPALAPLHAWDVLECILLIPRLAPQHSMAISKVGRRSRPHTEPTFRCIFT